VLGSEQGEAGGKRERTSRLMWAEREESAGWNELRSCTGWICWVAKYLRKLS